jgi:hypothetical protein
LPKDLLHRLSFCEFVDQLVEVSDLAHERVVDLLDVDTANYTLIWSTSFFVRPLRSAF